jgi:hypothetical protein
MVPKDDVVCACACKAHKAREGSLSGFEYEVLEEAVMCSNESKLKREEVAHTRRCQRKLAWA